MSHKLSTRICRTPQQLVEAAGALAILRAEFLPVEVSVARYVVKLTDEQRARLFWLHGLRAQALNAQWQERAAAIIAKMQEAGCPLSKLERTALLTKVWDKDEMHERWKERYGVRSASRIHGPRKMDMTDKITEYEADLLADGVSIPTEPAWEEAA